MALARSLVWPIGGEKAAPNRYDVALAAGLVVLAQVEVWTGAPDGSEGVFALLALPMCGALVWWRVAPFRVLLVVLAAQLAGLLIDVSYAPLFHLLTFLLACFSIAARSPLRLAIIGGLSAEAFFVAGMLIDDEVSLGGMAFVTSMVAILWSLGRLLHARGRQVDLLEERSLRLDREKAATEAAIQHERAAIAREVHDLLAHTVSVMVVQAGAAERMLETDPQEARQSLQHIRQRGHEAVLELRGLLTMLRGEPVTLSPQPGFADLDQLVQETRDAGLTVELKVSGPSHEIPAGIQLAAFRIVQEALTNVRKHAAATRVEVSIVGSPGHLEVEVSDDGRGPQGSIRGHGLIGMQERAALYGGTVTFGPGPDGGFAVAAQLLVQASGPWSAS